MSGPLLPALQIGLGTLLTVAAVGKILRPEEFTTAMRRTRIPETVVGVLGPGLPAAELMLALALVNTAGRWLVWAFVASFVLLGLFTLWLAAIVAAGLRVRCGCFGAVGAPVRARTVLRNLTLTAAAGIGAVLARRGGPGPLMPSLWLLIITTSVQMAVALLAAFRFGRPALLLQRPAQAAGPDTESTPMRP
jgi:hypothetical protein